MDKKLNILAGKRVIRTRNCRCDRCRIESPDCVKLILPGNRQHLCLR